MKTSLIALLLPAAASARFIEANEAKVLPPVDALLEDYSAPSRYLVEISPGVTEWVTEDEKWLLRRVSSP